MDLKLVMGSKKILFCGIILLVIGILIRKLTAFELSGLVLILVGVFFKTLYIIAKAKSGEYKPGKELLFLFIGLALLLSGIYLRIQEESPINPTYLILSGVALKVVFIVRFIQIVRSSSVIKS